MKRTRCLSSYCMCVIFVRKHVINNSRLLFEVENIKMHTKKMLNQYFLILSRTSKKNLDIDKLCVNMRFKLYFSYIILFVKYLSIYEYHGITLVRNQHLLYRNLFIKLGSTISHDVTNLPKNKNIKFVLLCYISHVKQLFYVKWGISKVKSIIRNDF